MDTPQEVIVWYVLPSARKYYVLAFKSLGLKQKQIAIIMDITESAVSQYLRQKRGEKVDFSNDLQKEIRESAKRVMQGKDFRKELQATIRKAEKTRFVCKVCNSQINTNERCNICF